jgi:hypothetical protein
LAVALWLVITIVPGLAVLRIVRTPGSWATSAVLAPPISFGFLYVVGLVATRSNASTETLCAVALALLVAVWLGLEVARLRRGPAAATAWVAGWRESWREPQLAAARGLLVLAVVGGITLWSVVQSKILVPAGWDAMHHGYFIRQIVEHHTLRPQVVLSSDPSRSDGTTGFYPLAANLTAALINVGSGIRISSVLIASMIALAGVILPLGTYVLVRRLAPGLPLVAGLAAVASLLPARLYTIPYTGRITVILGMALVPATAALLLWWGRRIDWRLAVVAPLAAIGVAGVHTSEVPIALGIVLPVVAVAALRERAWRASFAWLAYLIAIGAAAGAALYLVDPSVVHAVSERSGSFGPATGTHLPFGLAIERTIAVSAPFPAHNSGPMAIWSVLAFAGALATVHRRLRGLLGIGIAYIAWMLFYLLWIIGHLGPFARFADLWYRSTERMLWEFTVLGAVPVGIALYTVAALIHATAVRIRARGPRAVETRRRYSAAGVLVAAAVVAAMLALVTPPANTDANWLRTYASPVSHDSQRAFAYLAAHAGPNDRVLDDLENHGDLWMYVDDGVRTVFGNPPLIGGATVSWKDRLYLRGQLKRVATDPCVGRLLHAYNVTYVFYSSAKMWGGKPKITLKALQLTHFFHQVFISGTVRVFQVVAPDPPAGACTRDTTLRYPWSTLANSN